MFVHGLGVSTAYFRPALRVFAREYPVASVDLPGFGRSERPSRPLAVEELAAFLGRWMDSSGVERAPLVGNSMGCQIAVELAVQAPERVSGLVLVGPTADAAARTLPRQLGRLVRDSLREPPALTAVVVFDYLFRAGPLRTLRTARFMLDHPIEERAPLVAAPTLVVRGEHDPIVPQRWADDLVERFPQARAAVVEGAAHAAHFSHPAAVLAAARPVLDRG